MKNQHLTGIWVSGTLKLLAHTKKKTYSGHLKKKKRELVTCYTPRYNICLKLLQIMHIYGRFLPFIDGENPTVQLSVMSLISLMNF